MKKNILSYIVAGIFIFIIVYFSVDLIKDYIDSRQSSSEPITSPSIPINSEESAFDYLHNIYPMMTNFEIRHHLGSFLFTEDDVFKKHYFCNS